MLFNNVNLVVENGDRIAITGRNGSGKTTLIKILMNLVTADSGNFVWNENIKKAYYAQEYDNLNLDNDILTEVTEGITNKERRARNILGSLNIKGDSCI